MHYHPTFMPRLAPWLYRMWLLSNDKGIDVYARKVAPLRAVAAEEHAHFAKDAGISEQFRATGWIHLYHSAKSFQKTEGARRYADEFGVEYAVLTKAGLEELEPHINFDKDDHGVFWKGCVSVSSPKAVTKAYAAMFEARGGTFVKGDAASLKREGDAWSVTSQQGDIKAAKVVVSLGAWSLDLLKPMGYRFPLAAKRGYHQHFASKEGAFLNRPIVDEDVGFLMTPTEAGVRMTSGIEFAARDGKKTPIQIYRATDWARHPLSAGRSGRG